MNYGGANLQNQCWNRDGQFDGQTFPDQTPISAGLSPWIDDDSPRTFRIRKATKGPDESTQAFLPPVAPAVTTVGMAWETEAQRRARAPIRQIIAIDAEAGFLPTLAWGWDDRDALRSRWRNAAPRRDEEPLPPSALISQLLAQPGWEDFYIKFWKVKAPAKQQEELVLAPESVISQLLAQPGWEDYNVSKTWRIKPAPKQQEELVLAPESLISQLLAQPGWEIDERYRKQAPIRRATPQEDMPSSPAQQTTAPVVGWEVDEVRRIRPAIHRQSPPVSAGGQAPASVWGWDDIDARKRAIRPMARAQEDLPLQIAGGQSVVSVQGWDEVPQAIVARRKIARPDDQFPFPFFTTGAASTTWGWEEILTGRLGQRKRPAQDEPAILSPGQPAVYGWEEIPVQIRRRRFAQLPSQDVPFSILLLPTGPPAIGFVTKDPGRVFATGDPGRIFSTKDPGRVGQGPPT